jgi:hypothetical protein
MDESHFQYGWVDYCGCVGSVDYYDPGVENEGCEFGAYGEKVLGFSA